MTKDNFLYEYDNYSYLIKKGARLASLIYPVSLDNIQELTCKSRYDKDDVKWMSDPAFEDRVWLYKYEFVGHLIQQMYHMPYEAKEMLSGLLLGYSLDEEDKWLEYIRSHKEDFNQHEFMDKFYIYFPYNFSDSDVDCDYGEGFCDDPEYEDYKTEIDNQDFNIIGTLKDCEI